MAGLSIDLSMYNDRFQDTSFILDKQVNFVFGKNGTGKSTIAEAIYEQYHESKNVFLFDGYERFITEDTPLNAIALGTENAEIQKKINNINEKIKELEKNLDEDNEGSLLSKYMGASTEHEKAYSKLEDFYTESASSIKKIEKPQIADTSYNKTNLKNEIDKAEKLNEADITELKQIINSHNMGTINGIEFQDLKNDYFLEETNKLLEESIKLQVNIKDLDGNSEKQNFARQGLKIHKHVDEGENCAFCGNPISKERLLLLQKYFNNEVNNLDGKIDTLLSEIDNEIEAFSKIGPVDKDLFYESLRELVSQFNNELIAIKNSYIVYLQNLREVLKEKKKNLFISFKEIEETLESCDIKKVEAEIGGIINIHNNLSSNLDKEQKNSKEKLRYHEIYMMVNSLEYKKKIEEEALKREKKITLEKQVNEIKESIKKLEEEKQSLITETKDETIIAEKINKCLEKSGITSFKLILKEAVGTEEKGQYIVLGHNGIPRPIHKLSKGEKNIIAFLYFFFDIAEGNINNKIIIFDDPMSSNDDRLQYLMISKINELYSKFIKPNDFFILLTHNIHFYLNVRPYFNVLEDDKEEDPTKKYHEKKHYYKLHPDNNYSIIKQIKNKSEDYKTNYQELWDDLIFLYNEDRKLAMLNTCRRILETYMNFNCIEFNNFYKENEEAKKLFNVNSHLIDDFEIDLNGKTREDIITLLKNVFKKNEGENHFNAYFINNN